MPNQVEIIIGAKDDSTFDLEALKARLTELKAKIEATRGSIGIDDLAAQQKVARMQAALGRLSNRVYSAKLGVEGAARSYAEILGMEQALNRLQDKGTSGFRSWLTKGPAAVFRDVAQAAGNANGFLGTLGASIGALASSSLLGTTALGALAVAAGALLASLAPIVAALIPVTLGFGALAAVVIPVISQLKTGLTTLSTATDNYQQASQNLNTAIHKSHQDWKDYQATIHGLEPDFQNAAKLLTNQNVVWQSLSPSMQKSVIALSNNSTAMKALLPDQKAALTALLAQKAAWDNLTPAQQKLSGSLSGLGAQWQKAAKSVQPQIYQAFATTLDIIKKLMPALEPLLKAAGKAMDAFLKSMDNWLKSPSGQGFVRWLQTQGPKDIAYFGRVVWDMAVGIGLAFDRIYRAGVWLDKTAMPTVWGGIEDAMKNLVQWIGADFFGKINTFFVVDVPKSLDILMQSFRGVFAEILVYALRFLADLLDAMSHIPFIGHYFKTAADAVSAEMHRMQGDVSNAASSINRDLAGIRGRTVSVNVDLGAPPPGKINAITRGYATGTGGAAPGWAWVGERGPEIVKMHGGETVIPNHALGGYADGTIGFRDSIHPSVSVFDARVNSAVSTVENAVTHGIQRAFSRIVPRGGGGRTSAGGQYNLFDLESLWERAGGPGGYTAHVAGAIALAESGGNPNAENPSGASGLWQILGQVYPGNIFNPVINAINALTKYVDAGGFSPWVTYETGAYLQYMANGGRARPGLAMVGERGPELVGRGGIPVTLEIVGGDGEFGQFMATWIRKYVRVRGGNVQAVFGRN